MYHRNYLIIISIIISYSGRSKRYPTVALKLFEILLVQKGPVSKQMGIIAVH